MIGLNIVIELHMRQGATVHIVGVGCEKTFYATIQVDGTHLVDRGRFKTPSEAAVAYDEMAICHFGEFAKTNKMLGLL